MENFKKLEDGSILCIPMKKKFSLLKSEHNGVDIFDGSHVDKNGNTGVKGVTYLTGKAAEKECDKQGKKLLKDKAEVEQFISFFPGENTKEKIFNFVKLFGLEKAGCWDSYGKEWYGVGAVGYVYLSRVDGNDDVAEVGWNTVGANIYWDGQEYPSPFLACEDCNIVEDDLSLLGNDNLFDSIVELCESVGGKCCSSFGYKLGKLLDSKLPDDTR